MTLMRNLVLALAAIAFIAVIGAAIYEHVAVVPRWSMAPPASLSMFQGAYGVHPEPFWKMIHPVALLLFITALIFNRKNERKKFIGWVLGAYVAILAITAVYFVPELISITTTPFQNRIDADLTARAAMWERLSIVRLFVLVFLAVTLLLSLTKPAEKTVA